MKKRMIAPFLALVYAASFSLGFQCMISTDSRHPRLSVFCTAVGLGCLVVLVGLLLLNWLRAEDWGYTRKMWVLQFLGALVISLPLLELWKLLFRFLMDTF